MSRDIVIGMLFDSPNEYAKSGSLDLIALNSSCLEELVETVLAHEDVHIVLSRLFEDLPLGELLRVQKGWDIADIGVFYNQLEKKVELC